LRPRSAPCWRPRRAITAAHGAPLAPGPRCPQPRAGAAAWARTSCLRGLRCIGAPSQLRTLRPDPARRRCSRTATPAAESMAWAGLRQSRWPPGEIAAIAARCAQVPRPAETVLRAFGQVGAPLRPSTPYASGACRGGSAGWWRQMSMDTLVRQDKPGASSGCDSRPGKGNEPPHRESSLGRMEATTWAKRRQSDVRAVTQVKRFSLVRQSGGRQGRKLGRHQ